MSKSNLILTPNSFQWQTDSTHLHWTLQSIALKNLFQTFLWHQSLYINGFWIRRYHGGCTIIVSCLGVYRYSRHSKAQKRSKKGRNTSQLVQTNYDNRKFVTTLLTICAQKWTKSPTVRITIQQRYLPKSWVPIQCRKACRRYKKYRYFWESLQLIKIVFQGRCRGELFGNFVASNIQKNPQRIRFFAFLKILMEWYFANLDAKTLGIKGIRVQLKGRFVPKSRTKKLVVGVGRLGLQQKREVHFYHYTHTVTIYGNLSIKIWICPRSKTYASTTKKNEIQ